jgi:hypothetical protein
MADDDDTVLRRRVVEAGVDPRTPDTDDTIIRDGRSRPAPGSPPVGVAPDTAAAAAGRVPAVRIGGQVVPLTTTLVVGRRPRLQRVERRAEPRAIVVPSPGGEVSSTHLRIWAEGAAVVVEDQRSTNGTVIREPGRAPRRVPSGGTVVVLTGTVVDIGDGNLIEILSPRLSIPHGSATPTPGLHH